MHSRFYCFQMLRMLLREVAMNKIIMLVSLSSLGCAVAQAAPKPTVRLEMFQIREVTKEGRTVELAEKAPDSVAPGTILEQRITVENASDKSVAARAVRLPIPKGLTFISVGKSSIPVTYSLDGKVFAAQPLKQTVVDGKVKEVPAPLSEYRMIRWELSRLDPRESKTFSARFKVE